MGPLRWLGDEIPRFGLVISTGGLSAERNGFGGSSAQHRKGRERARETNHTFRGDAMLESAALTVERIGEERCGR